MLKYFAFAVFVLSASGCSSVAQKVAKEECWKHTIDRVDLARNTLTMCSNGIYATRTIYYPNPNSAPTTCSQAGTVDTSREKIDFNLKVGECENGRQVGPAEIHCTRTDSQDLVCNIDNQEGFLFSRTGHGIMVVRFNHRRGRKALRLNSGV
ncbi:hypothetical protein, partial [Thermomonas carbonis]|uniref:hypothetical protein n=1 Tax=Thermomonas carbonis TaxID=1463158 RepID=UPI001E2F47E3